RPGLGGGGAIGLNSAGRGPDSGAVVGPSGRAGAPAATGGTAGLCRSPRLLDGADCRRPARRDRLHGSDPPASARRTGVRNRISPSFSPLPRGERGERNEPSLPRGEGSTVPFARRCRMHALTPDA